MSNAARQTSMKEELHRTLREQLESVPDLLVLGEDIRRYGGAFGVTGDLWKRFPQRLLNTPISENSFVGVAVGAALGGTRVVVELMFMDFIALAMDQIVNHAAKVHYMYNAQLSVPIVLRTPYGGYRGYGPSHSQCLVGWFMSVPGLKIVVPSGPSHAGPLLRRAIEDDNPVLFLEHKLLYGDKVEAALAGSEDISMGRARLVREGEDVSIITFGLGVKLSLLAAEELTGEGLSAEVLDLVSLKPYDASMIFDSVRKTGKAVFVEEGVKTGGVGAEICSAVAEECLWDLDGGLVRVGAEDLPIPASPSAERVVLPDVDSIVKAARRALAP